MLSERENGGRTEKERVIDATRGYSRVGVFVPSLFNENGIPTRWMIDPIENKKSGEEVETRFHPEGVTRAEAKRVESIFTVMIHTRERGDVSLVGCARLPGYNANGQRRKA